MPDRGLGHALGADRSTATLTPHRGLVLGVPVARRLVGQHDPQHRETGEGPDKAIIDDGVAHRSGWAYSPVPSLRPALPSLRSVHDREIARLAVPALGTLVAEPLYVLADTAIVGRIGTEELAGLALASAVLLSIHSLMIFLAYGTTATVSRPDARPPPRQSRWPYFQLQLASACPGRKAWCWSS